MHMHRLRRLEQRLRLGTSAKLLVCFSVFARVSTSIHIGGGAIRSTTPLLSGRTLLETHQESPGEDSNNTRAVPCSIWDAKRIQL